MAFIVKCTLKAIQFNNVLTGQDGPLQELACKATLLPASPGTGQGGCSKSMHLAFPVFNWASEA